MPAPAPQHKPPRLVSLRLLAGILAVILVLAWFFTPSRRDLLDRQLSDGANARALQTLQSMGAWERRTAPADYALLEMRLGRELLDTKNAAAVRMQLAAAFRLADKFKFAGPFRLELQRLLNVVPQVEVALEIAKPWFARMPAAARRAMNEIFVTRALASGKPEQAALLFADLWKAAPDESSTLELVRLWRAAGKPAQALAAIEAFPMPRGKTLAQISPALARRRVELLRETGQPGKALDALLELQAVAPEPMRAELFALLVATARESNRAGDVLAEVKRRAEAAKTDANLWRLLGDLAVGAGQQQFAVEAGEHLVALAPNDRALRFKLGQLHEWNGQPARAFDVYLAALSLGELTAIDRLRALNPGLYRDDDLAAALTASADSLNWQKHGQFLARLQASVGRYDEAIHSYERLVQQRPDDAELLREFGRLSLDLSDYSQALKIYARFESLRPGSLTAPKAIAECLFRVGRYEESFARYLRVWQQSHDDTMLENCVTLAESLGRLDVIPLLLQERMRHTKHSAASEFRRLAHYQTLLGDTAGVRDTLEAGLKQFPDNTEMQLQLAYLLGGERRPLDAARVIERNPRLRSQPELAHLYASLLLDAEHAAEAETFIATLDAALLSQPAMVELKKRLALATVPATTTGEAATTPVETTDPAKLYQANPTNAEYALAYAWQLFDKRRYAQVERVLKPFLARPTPGIASLTAQLAAARNDYASAEAWQRYYIATKPDDAGAAWNFLGDVYQGLGQPEKARAAWQRGLRETLSAMGRAKAQ
ncbi:MAG: tetratricopeptide repeat protein [Verrucomicrobia bacterium]|nr:tetratricopeptide repeat protein [Verrucomicrobiota bacterium]